MAMTRSAAPSSWRTHGLLLLLAAVYADNYVGRQIVAVMIEPIKREFGASDTSMGLISGLAFAAVFALLGLPAGRLADRLPRIRLVAASCLLWGLATMLCGLAGGFALLVLARMAVAVAEAPAAPAALSMIADLYPPQRRAFAISVFTAAPTFAAILALSGGAWLVDALGWRATFMIVGAPALLLAGVLALGAREPQRGRWDGAPAAALPGMRETVAGLWANRPLRKLILASALATLGGTAFGMWNATFLVRSHGLELRHAGLLTGLIGGIGAGVGVMFGAWLSDRVGSKVPRLRLAVPLAGHLLGIVTLAAYLLWPTGTIAQIGTVPVPAAMIWCALNGFVMVWWMGPSFALLTVLAPPHGRAMALAMQTLLGTLLGVGIGPVLTGALSDLLQPGLGIESLRYALLFVCVTTALAAGLLNAVRRQIA